MLGVVTNIEFARFLVADDVRAGKLDTGLLDRRADSFTPEPVPTNALIAVATVAWLETWADVDTDIWSAPTGWRVGANAPCAVVDQ